MVWACAKDAKEEFVKRVYQNKIEGGGVRRSPVGCMNEVEKYLRKRGVRMGELQGMREECWNGENWRLFCFNHPQRGSSQRKRGVRAIDRLSLLWFPHLP